jgi:SAM-dependent methyltransferase
MSGFSDVDGAPDPARLVSSLAESAAGLAAMKHYIGATHRRWTREGPVLDVGCGAGHDLEVLAGLGVAAVGVDSSAVMVSAASERFAGYLVRGSGEGLPFRSGSFSGGWVERVLMHVADPAAVIREVVRCVAPGGVITVFEPDWSSVEVDGHRVPARWLTAARHPAVGAETGSLLEAAGCRVMDRVEERSWWDKATFDQLLRPRLERAAAEGLAPMGAAQDVIERAAVGGAVLVKVLWVATTVEPHEVTGRG